VTSSSTQWAAVSTARGAITVPVQMPAEGPAAVRRFTRTTAECAGLHTPPLNTAGLASLDAVPSAPQASTAGAGVVTGGVVGAAGPPHAAANAAVRIPKTARRMRESIVASTACRA